MIVLWQTLVLVTLAWISGGLAGSGFQDLRNRRSLAVVGRSTPSSAAKVTDREAGPTTGMAAARNTLEQTQPAPPAPDAPTRARPRLWFVDTPDPASADPQPAETTLEMPAAPVPSPKAPVAASRLEPVASPEADTSGVTGVVSLADAQGLSIPEATRPEATRTAASPARASSPKIAARPASQGRSPLPVRMLKPKQSTWYQRLGESMHHMNFWIELALMVLLVVGAFWGLTFFMTFPSPPTR